MVEEQHFRRGQVLEYREETSPSDWVGTWMVWNYQDGLVQLRGYNHGEINHDREMLKGAYLFLSSRWTLGEYIGCPSCENELLPDDDYVCRGCRYGS
jgi:hypothetical protein